MEKPCINKVILSYPILSYPRVGGGGGGQWLRGFNTSFIVCRNNVYPTRIAGIISNKALITNDNPGSVGLITS